MLLNPSHGLLASVLSPVQHLGHLAELSQRTRRPLVLLASTLGCPHCHYVRRHHLIPMQQRHELLAYELDLQGTTPIFDFKGQTTTAKQWLHERGVRLAPTLLFLGFQGQETVPRLEGVTLVDFYGSYLEDRIIKMRQSM